MFVKNIINVQIEKFFDENGNYIGTFNDEIDEMMHKCTNCQSFLFSDFKKLLSKDYVKTYFLKNQIIKSIN